MTRADMNLNLGVWGINVSFMQPTVSANKATLEVRNQKPLFTVRSRSAAELHPCFLTVQIETLCKIVKFVTSVFKCVLNICCSLLRLLSRKRYTTP